MLAAKSFINFFVRLIQWCHRWFQGAGPAILIDRIGPERKKKNWKLKLRFFGFEQNKEIKRKGINASKLTTRISLILQKCYEYTLCFFYFYLVFLKNQIKWNMPFFCNVAINIKKIEKWFVTCYRAQFLRILTKNNLNNNFN